MTCNPFELMQCVVHSESMRGIVCPRSDQSLDPWYQIYQDQTWLFFQSNMLRNRRLVYSQYLNSHNHQFFSNHFLWMTCNCMPQSHKDYPHICLSTQQKAACCTTPLSFADWATISDTLRHTHTQYTFMNKERRDGQHIAMLQSGYVDIEPQMHQVS